MHNRQWATPLPAVIGLTLGGFVLVVAAFLTGADPAGRLLIVLAALGLWITAGLAAYQRPRLWIENDPSPQLSMKRLSGVQRYGREQIVRIKLVRYPRLGRRVPMLEIDVLRPGEDEERLIVFGRWDLGTNPQDVFDSLEYHGLVPTER